MNLARVSPPAVQSRLSMLRTATWTLSNLCRFEPAPEFARVRGALPTLATLIELPDTEMLTDACWALSYLTDNDDNGSNSKIEAVLDAGTRGAAFFGVPRLPR